MRYFAPATLLILFSACLSRADRMSDYGPIMRAAVSDIVVIGKVTELDKESVEAKAHPGATEKTKFTIATVKIETDIRGAKNLTHVKVGFYPGSSGTGGSYKFPVLKQDDEVCVFLIKHPDSHFYIFPPLAPPIPVTENSKAVMDRLKQSAAVFNDPANALKSDKVEVRTEAACFLLMQYLYSHPGRELTRVAVPLVESQVILKALAEADWIKTDQEFDPGRIFANLGITGHAKFAKIQPKPGEDFKQLWRTEFRRWLPVDGKDFQIEKFVPKAK